jgi:hypothetical protein
MGQVAMGCSAGIIIPNLLKKARWTDERTPVQRHDSQKLSQEQKRPRILICNVCKKKKRKGTKTELCRFGNVTVERQQQQLLHLI